MGTTSMAGKEQWITWEKLKLQGLLPKQEFDKVQKIVGVSDLNQYITFMIDLTPIRDKFTFKWDSGSNLWYKQSLNHDSDHLKSMKELSTQFRSFKSRYEVELAFFKKRVQSIEDKITTNEHAIKTHFLQYQQKIDQLHQGCFTQ
jgi:hypothetical protein